MDKKIQKLITLLAASGLASASALADDEMPLAEASVDYVEAGVGYVSEDAWKFGQYNGLNQKGPYIIGNFQTENHNEDGEYFRSIGTNLGLESRYLRLEGGNQGRQQFFFEYDELPNYMNNTGKTPYLDPGSSTLFLPTGYDYNNIDAYLQPLELKTKRERVGFGAAFFSEKHWKFDIAFQHETKEGTQAIGSAMGSTGISSPVGNAVGALLPEPIDYNTDEMDVGLHYSKGKGQFDIGYHVSLFNNSNDSLTWQNAVPNTNPNDPTLPQPNTLGRMSLAPDNQLHQLTASGGYTLPYQTRLTGMLSVGRSTQNEDLLPYSVAPNALPPLPRSSAEAEVWLTSAQFKVASRPNRKLRLSANYRFHDRSNRTPIDSWTYIIADGDNFATAENSPLSYTKNRLDLDANYRINSSLSFLGGYKYDHMYRSYNDTEEREKTQENTLLAKLKGRSGSKVDYSLYAEAGARDGSEYIPYGFENPALRKFNMADRNRGKVGAKLGIMPTTSASIGLSADYISDDYTNSVIGLTEAQQTTATVDFSYLVSANITTYAYYTYDDIPSSQSGSESTPGAADWVADFKDTFNTVGLGFKAAKIASRWDVGADITYADSTGKIDMNSDLAANQPAGQYPDLKTSMGSFKLWTDYQVSKNIAVNVSYWYQTYREDNWAVDDLDVDSVANMLLLGEETLDYDVHVIAASAKIKF